MEIGSGNFEVVDAPGNLTLRTSSATSPSKIPGGKVNLDNRNGNIQLRYSSAPKDDIQVNNSSSENQHTPLPANSSFEIQADCHSCDIDSDSPALLFNKTSTKSGDTHLEGK